MNPLDVVVRILNNQLSSLMWIDEKVSADVVNTFAAFIGFTRNICTST